MESPARRIALLRYSASDREIAIDSYQHLTLSDTDAALLSVEDELKRLQQRRTKLLSHRLRLNSEGVEPAVWPEDVEEDILQPVLEARPFPRGEEPPLVHIADLKRWSAFFPWSAQIDELKKKYFNISEFRPLQREVINATMSGHDCFIIMPTGGGKSLLYQLPGLLGKGVTLVISPLISLMHDQVAILEALDIPAIMLTGETPKAKQKQIEDELSSNKQISFRFLFVTPEKIAKAKRFVGRLEKLYTNGQLDRVVIDECHCCSSWGHDFRPDYLQLGRLRKLFSKAPILACTATATRRVQTDVIEILGMQRVQVFRSSFNRINLIFEVRPKTPAVIADLAEFIKSTYPKGSGIVYCLSKKDTEKVAQGLQEGGIKAVPYHADMSVLERERYHKQWSRNHVQIAFGMGINKPDVRFVLHHTLSKSFDAYYQESGRAGRDGDFAHCILYYKAADFSKQSAMVGTARGNTMELLKRLVAYCQDYTLCRRKLMADHFGEPYNAAMCENVCDNCANRNVADSGKQPPKDVTDDAKKILEILEEHKGRKATLTQLVSDYKGELSKDHCERLVVQMTLAQVLQEVFSQNAYSTVCYLKRGERPVRSLHLDLPPKIAGKAKRRSSSGGAAALANTELREIVTKLREEIAEADPTKDVAPWQVFEDRILSRIVSEQPTSVQQLEGIMGAQRAKKLGARIIAAVTKWLAEDEVAKETPVAKKYKSTGGDKDGDEKKDKGEKKDKKSKSSGADLRPFLVPVRETKDDSDFEDKRDNGKRQLTGSAPAQPPTLASVASNSSRLPLTPKSASLILTSPAAPIVVTTLSRKVTEVVLSDDDSPRPVAARLFSPMALSIPTTSSPPAATPPPSVPAPSPLPVTRCVPKRKRIIDDDSDAEEQLRRSETADKVLKSATADELAQLETQQHSLPLSCSPPLRPKSVIDVLVASEEDEHRRDDSSSALRD